MIYDLLVVVVECFMFSLSTALTGKVREYGQDLSRGQFVIFKLRLFVVQDNKDASDSTFGESSRFSFFTAISDMADK